MKATSFYFIFLFLVITESVKSQESRVDPKQKADYDHFIKSNYICDSLFTLYTDHWKHWWSKLSVPGPIPGYKEPAHFAIPYSDLQLLDSLGHNGLLPDSVEAFFAFTSNDDLKNNQITAIIQSKDTSTFKKNIKRWKDWSSKHIKNTLPEGFKIRFADLDSMFHLLDNRSNPIINLTGYFIFHSKNDADKNQISIVFRPVFKHTQTKVDNNKITCGNPKIIRTGSLDKGKSFVNIDFTNPCPPCDTSG